MHQWTARVRAGGDDAAVRALRDAVDAAGRSGTPTDEASDAILLSALDALRVRPDSGLDVDDARRRRDAAAGRQVVRHVLVPGMLAGELSTRRLEDAAGQLGVDLRSPGPVKLPAAATDSLDLLRHHLAPLPDAADDAMQAMCRDLDRHADVLAVLPVLGSSRLQTRLTRVRVVVVDGQGEVDVVGMGSDPSLREAARRAGDAVRRWLSVSLGLSLDRRGFRVELLGIPPDGTVVGGSLGLPLALAIVGALARKSPAVPTAATGALAPARGEEPTAIEPVELGERKLEALRSGRVRRMLCPTANGWRSDAPGLVHVGSFEAAVAEAFAGVHVERALQRRLADPRQRRRRRLTLLGAAGLLITGGARATLTEVARHADEAHLAEVDAGLDPLLQQGDWDAAGADLEQALTSVGDAEVRASSWGRLGASAAQQGAYAPAVRYLVRAAAAAPTSAPGNDALVTLTRTWLDQGDARRAQLSFDWLKRDAPDLASSAQLADLRATLALARWDAVGALDEGIADDAAAPAIAALAGVRADPTRTLERPIALPPGWSLHSRAHTMADRFDHELHSSGAPDAAPRVTWQGGVVHAAAVAARRLWIAEDKGGRTIRSVSLDGPEDVVEVDAVAQQDSLIRGLIAADVDGDGDDELVVALAEWRAYGLAVLDAQPDGGAPIVWQQQVGELSALATLPALDGGPPLIVAATAEEHPSPAIFSAPPFTGGRAGVALFRWEDGGLRERARLAAPGVGASSAPRLTSLTATDLDGDGLDDLVLGIEQRHGDRVDCSTWVLRRTGETRFAQATLGVVAADTLTEADGDASPELVGHDADRAVWIAGLADEGALPTSPRPVPPEPLEDGRAAAWRGAWSIGQLDLHDEASRAFEALARSSGSAEARQAGLLEAAREADRAMDPERAAALALGAAGPDALALALDDLLLAGDLDRASETAARLAALDPATASVASALSAHATEPWSQPGPGDLLAATSSLDEPLLFRVEPDRGLRLDTLQGDRPAAALALDRTDAIVELALTIDVERTEWASGQRLAIVDGTGQAVAAALVTAQGGGGRLERRTACKLHGGTALRHTRHVLHTSTDPATLRVRIVLAPAAGIVTCRIDEQTPDGPEIIELARGPLAALDEGLRLQLGSTNYHDAPWWASTVLHDVRVRGASFAPQPAHSLLAGHRALAAGEIEGAARAYAAAGDTPESQAWLALTLAVAGDPAAAARLRDALSTRDLIGWDTASPPDPLQRRLADLARARPELLGPVLRDVLGADAWAALRLRDAEHRADRNTGDDDGVVAVTSEALLVGETAGGLPADTERALRRLRSAALTRLGRSGEARADDAWIAAAAADNEQARR